MAEQLGKITKPEARPFLEKRKLFLVPLLFSDEDAPPEYKEKFDLYWEQVSRHLASLEAKLGKISHIYHDSISLAGEDGLKVMEKLNRSSYLISRSRCEAGAVLEATEDKALVEESVDWERCFIMGLISQKATRAVSEFYLEAYRKRYEHIAQSIEKTLQAGEVGILFIREGHRVQFPQDMEVFSVLPPAYNEIQRWHRDRPAHGEEGHERPG